MQNIIKMQIDRDNLSLSGFKYFKATGIKIINKKNNVYLIESAPLINAQQV